MEHRDRSPGIEDPVLPASPVYRFGTKGIKTTLTVCIEPGGSSRYPDSGGQPGCTVALIRSAGS